MTFQKRIALIAITFMLVGFSLSGCGPGADEVAAKYTEQTAKAIIESGWHLSAAIVIAAFLRGMMNK